MIHLKQVGIHPDRFPVKDVYPFDLAVWQQAGTLDFKRTTTFFIGENGAGKSTLLKAISQKCNIHIWQDDFNFRMMKNRYAEELYTALSVTWQNGPVKGSFFSSQIFSHFAQNLEEWAASDAGMLDYFGGRSLITQSHGQSLMAYFKSRYTIQGLYFLDEPETALSPTSLIELLKLLNRYNRTGEAQFIIATHSPILLACPGATIYSFGRDAITQVAYEETDYYKIYKSFMNAPDRFVD